MTVDTEDVAAGGLATIAIDFEHPDCCEFSMGGHGGRFRVPRRLLRASSVVAVAYISRAAGPSEVAGMIVHGCGRPATLRDREILRTAAARRIGPPAATGTD